MVLSLPTNPKLTDVVTALAVVDQRLAVLEEYVGRNDLRITTLEQGRIEHLEEFAAEHQAGADAREQELESVRQQLGRDRWLRTLRR